MNFWQRILFCATLFFVNSYAADPLWTWRNPLPSGNTIYHGVHTAKGYVLLANEGTILRSVDGKDWTLTHIGGIPGLDMSQIATNGSVLVVAGLFDSTQSCIYYSLDNGDTWLPALQPASLYKPNLVAWNGTEFLALGYFGKSYRSPDGIHWTRTTNSVSSWYQDLTWDGSQWVAVGMSGLIITSPDGDTWTQQRSGINTTLYGIAAHKNELVAVGDSGVILYSADGIQWAQRNSPNFFKGTIWDVKYTENGWVTAGNGGALFLSPDAQMWTESTKIWLGPGQIRTIIANGSEVLFAGYSGNIYSLTDMTSLTVLSKGSIANLFSIVWTGSRFVAVGDSGRVHTSLDGITWKALLSDAYTQLNSVVWNGTQLVAVGGSKIMVSDANGETWTSQKIEETNLLALAWNGSTWVASGTIEDIWTSPDAVVWTKHNIPFPNHIYEPFHKLEWTGKRFVGINTFGNIRTSVDGATWDIAMDVDFEDFKAIVLRGDSVLVLGDDSTVVSSFDQGTTWNQRKETTWLGIHAALWLNDRFLGVGSWGNMAESDDGVGWVRRNSGISRDINAIATNGTRIVAVGLGGMIISIDKSQLGGVPTSLRTVRKAMIPGLNTMLMRYDLLGRTNQ
jgi:hypothetical protein